MQINFRHIVLASAALAAAAITVPTAQAESTRIKIPFNFVAEGKSLPAGEYIVERNANTNFLALHARATGQGVVMVGSPTDPGAKAVTLRFDERDNTHVLESVHYGSLVASKLNGKGGHREDISPKDRVGQ